MNPGQPYPNDNTTSEKPGEAQPHRSGEAEMRH